MHKSQTHHASCVYNSYVCLRVCMWVILNRKKCLHFIFGKVQRSNPVKKWYVTPTCCGLRSRSVGRPLSHILFCALLFLWSVHKTINISGDFRLWGRSWSCGRFINNDCQRRLLIVCVCAVAYVCVRVGVCCVRAASHDSLRAWETTSRVLTVLFLKTCCGFCCCCCCCLSLICCYYA